MSKKKYNGEKLMEAARDWFDTLGYEQEEIILNEYMARHGIKDEDVDW